jgi:hypothetical protein
LRVLRSSNGYETEIWPIPHHPYADLDDDAVKALIRDPATELERSYGPTVADLARDLAFYRRCVWVQLAVLIVLFAIIFALHGKLSPFYTLLLGVLANLLTVVVLDALRPPGRHLLGRR